MYRRMIHEASHDTTEQESSDTVLRIIDLKPGDPYFDYYGHTDNSADALDTVAATYPARVTPYLLRQMESSEAIRRQYLPDPDEAITRGTPTPFEEGKDTTGIYGLERLYADRVLITPHFDCPAYCRFCYKKSRVMRGKRPMTYEEIDRAVSAVAKMSEVRGALITGGDPLMDTKKLMYLLDKLIETPNVFEIRIGTRCLLHSPQIFTDALCDALASYIRPCFEDASRSRYLAINVHFNHPDELSDGVLRACHQLTSRGITLRNQTVLLKKINDDTATIKRLFQLLLRNNMIPYYLNHCMPVENSDHMRTSVQRGQDIYRALCTESATSIPHYVYAPAAGKVHVGPDTVFDYVDAAGGVAIDVATLYRAHQYRRITGKELPAMHMETDDGFIRGTYRDGVDSDSSSRGGKS